VLSDGQSGKLSTRLRAEIQKGETMSNTNGVGVDVSASTPIATAIIATAAHNGNGTSKPAVIPAVTAVLPGVKDCYRGIHEVSKMMSEDGVGKNGQNDTQHYSFRGIDDVMNGLSAPLVAAGLLILPTMLSRTMTVRESKTGGVLFFVLVEAAFDFTSIRDGSMHRIMMYGDAMDTGDKATNKAMSAAYKYACVQVFCIPTEGMADGDKTTYEIRDSDTPRQGGEYAYACESAAEGQDAPWPDAPCPFEGKAKTKPAIDTGGHPMGTAAASAYVGEQKLAALQQGKRELTVVPDAPEPPALPWKSANEMVRAFERERERVSETEFRSTFERYGWHSIESLRKAVIVAKNLEARKNALDAYNYLLTVVSA
jgi:hypothetical protein